MNGCIDGTNVTQRLVTRTRSLGSLVITMEEVAPNQSTIMTSNDNGICSAFHIHTFRFEYNFVAIVLYCSLQECQLRLLNL